MVIIESPETIGQTEAARSETDAERIRQPFREKVNSGFATVADVSADVEKFVGGDRFEKPFADPSAEARPHSRQGERNDADESASVAQIEGEGNIALEHGWVCLVVNEDGAVPTRVK